MYRQRGRKVFLNMVGEVGFEPTKLKFPDMVPNSRRRVNVQKYALIAVNEGTL
jgi:hypothetical protein